jgi:hypothetical protein
MRGKHGAQAATRRAEAAEAEAAALKVRLAEEQAEHRAERQALADQVAQLQGRLSNEVRHLADAEVRRARAEVSEVTRRAEEEKNERAKRAARILRSEDVKYSGPTILADLADALDVPVGLLFEANGLGNRNAKRSSTARLREIEALRSSGLADLRGGDR